MRITKNLLVPIKDLKTNKTKLWNIPESIYNNIIQQVKDKSKSLVWDKYTEKLVVSIDSNFDVTVKGIEPLNDK
jgi:hypothetical protein